MLAQQFLEIRLPFAFSFVIILHIEAISQNPFSFYTLKWPYLLIDACSHEWCVDKFLLGDDMEVGESLHIKMREDIWGLEEEQEGLQKRSRHTWWGTYCLELLSLWVKYSDLMLVLTLLILLLMKIICAFILKYLLLKLYNVTSFVSMDYRKEIPM